MYKALSAGRPVRHKDKVFQRALAEEYASDSDDTQNRRKRKAKPKAKATGKGKGKEKQKEEGESDPEDLDYSGGDVNANESDSDVDAKMTHEEVADSLPTKTIPQGTSRRPKGSKDKRPPRKKKKTTHMDEASNTAEPDAASTEKEVHNYAHTPHVACSTFTVGDTHPKSDLAFL
ncbi:hypothetical protein C8J57DRAFT_1244838 [Mycena rebaudengoi]|nr:hypothetical protein C8J57DRAFT_1244838 [Mycena rebaudengoi]